MDVEEVSEVLNEKAAVVAYTRLKNIGFPRGFTVQPEDFNDREVKTFVKYVHDAMDSAEELRSLHKQAKVIISDENYVVLGIVAYIRDLFQDGWDASDKGNRLVYGFFGYVWHRCDFIPLENFPELSSFTDIIEKWIRPHWDDSENCKWAEKPHYSKYEYSVGDTKSMSVNGEKRYHPGLYSGRPVIIESNHEEDMVHWGLKRTLQEAHFSLCTNLCIYSIKDFSTSFHYVVKLKGTETYTRNRTEVKVPGTEQKDLIAEDEKIASNNQTRTDIMTKHKLQLFMVFGVVTAVIVLVLLLSALKRRGISSTMLVALIVFICVAPLFVVILFRENNVGRKDAQEKVKIDAKKEPNRFEGSGIRSANSPERQTEKNTKSSESNKKISGDKKTSSDKKERKETSEDVFSL